MHGVPMVAANHRAEIIAHLESQKDAASLTAKLKAGALALANGLPLTIGGLVDEAIARAVNTHSSHCLNAEMPFT